MGEGVLGHGKGQPAQECFLFNSLCHNLQGMFSLLLNILQLLGFCPPKHLLCFQSVVRVSRIVHGFDSKYPIMKSITPQNLFQVYCTLFHDASGLTYLSYICFLFPLHLRSIDGTFAKLNLSRNLINYIAIITQ